MEPNKILQADLLDVIFEGRNKDYGAYELRKKYHKRIVLALVITAALAVAAVLASIVAQQINKNKDHEVKVSEVVLQQVTQKTRRTTSTSASASAESATATKG